METVKLADRGQAAPSSGPLDGASSPAACVIGHEPAPSTRRRQKNCRHPWAKEPHLQRQGLADTGRGASRGGLAIGCARAPLGILAPKWRPRLPSDRRCAIPWLAAGNKCRVPAGHDIDIDVRIGRRALTGREFVCSLARSCRPLALAGASVDADPLDRERHTRPRGRVVQHAP